MDKNAKAHKLQNLVSPIMNTTPRALIVGLILGVSLLASSLQAQTQAFQADPRNYKINSIKVNPNTTPAYQYSLAEQKKTGRAKTWMEIEVDFASNADFTPELTLNFFAAVNVKQNNSALTGSITLVGVEKGSNKYAVMYISPQSLTYIYGGKTPTRPSADQVTVQISYQGQVLAEESLNASPRSPWWNTLRAESGYLLNLSETPFAPIYSDYYEALKITPGR